jgi:hypothetical protein
MVLLRKFDNTKNVRMQTLILESDNKKALKAIKAIAEEMNIKTTEKKTEAETDDYYYWKGVKVKKAKGKLDIKALSGSLSDINFEDPSVIRKKAWTRKKAQS